MSARWTTRATTVIAAAILTVSTGVAQPTTPTAPQPAEAKPRAAPTTQPRPKAETPRPEPLSPQPVNIRFQFRGENYRDVIQFIARAAKKPILGDLNAVQGTLTYFDAKPYTFIEALGIVNHVLRASQPGFNLVDAGRYIELVRISRMAQNPNLPLLLKGLDEEPRRPEDEIVTTILPLQYIDAPQAVQIVARMVHTYGTLSPLESGKGIIITDTVNNIRRIQRLLTSMDKGTLAKQQLKYYRLKNASAAEVARLIEALFGKSRRARRYVYNQQRNRYEPAPVDPSEQVTVTSDPRSNTIVVIGSSDSHTMIAEMIVKLDLEEVAGAGAVRIFVLKNAKPSELAKTLIAAVPSTAVTVRGPRGRQVTRQVPSARIVPDDATSRVVVSAEPDVMKQVESIIKELDAAATEAAGLRIFPLKVANASSLVGVIQNTFAVRGPRGRTTVSFSITAEPRTNSLVVRAPAADMEAIAKLIQEFDKQTATEREFHVVRLAAGDAREMARSLMNLLSRQRDPRRRRSGDDAIRVEADRGTNSLIISAAPGDWQQIKSVLDKLTEQAPAAVASTRIFKLEHAKAPDIARTLQRIFDARRRAVRRGQPQPIPVVITHDTQSNSLVVSASGDDLAEIEKLLTPLDLPPELAVQIQVRSYTLANASATNLARSLSRLFATQRGRRGTPEGEIQPKFEAETGSNQLVVAATAEQFQTIEELIQRIQKEAGLSETVVKLFALENAKASQLAPALTRVVQAEMEAMQRRAGARRRRSDFQISADTRTNTLLITAPLETMAIIEQLIPKLDAADVKVQITKVVELENADPNELAAAVNAALAGQPPAPPRRGRRPQVPLTGLAGRNVIVVAEQSARAVLLTGVTEDVEFAEKLIKKIDARPSTEKATVETFRLKHAKAEALARVLSNTVGRMRRGRRAVPTSISAEKNANAIVVSAAGDVMERIVELLAQLDVEGSEGALTIEIVRLVNSKADQMAAALNAAQGADPRRRSQRGQADEGVVRVTADAASNSLLLTGQPAQIEETKKLIVTLDMAAAELTSEMRIFRLARSKATDMVAVLERILLDQSRRRGRRGGPPAADVRIAAQERANAVVVQGPPEAVALAEEIIKQFDSEVGTDAVIQIVPLAKAEANSLAQAVNQILAQQAPRGRRPPGAAADNAVVVPETNSNSLLVRGTKVQVQQAVELIRQLDQGGEGFAAQVRVFTLKHAAAYQTAKTLELLFRQILQQQRQRRRGRNAPPPSTFSIAADDRTNSLIISTSTANFTIVEPLLAKLDEEATATLRDVQYIPLLHVDAADLVTKIEAMFSDRKVTDRPVVESDELSNGLTIIANEADFRAIDAVVAKWDEAAEANYIQVRVIPLSGQVPARDMAEMLKRLYEQVSGAQVEVTDRLPARTSPDAGRDLFILPAPAAPTTQPAGGAATKTTTAPTSQPATAAASQAPVIIAVDEGSSSLIVSASRSQIEEIEMLIWNLSSSQAVADAKPEVFRIKIADPVSIAKTLNALFNPKPVAAPRPGRQPQQRGSRRQQQQPAPRPAKPTIFITADTRTRSVIVHAKPTDLKLIGELIKKLDTAAEVVVELRIIQLENVDAVEAAQNLRELFQMRAAGRPGAAAKGKAPKSQPPIQQMLVLRGADKVDPSAGITVSANRMTNSIIVAAPAEAMKLIEDLVKELDQSPAVASRAVKMFPIKHAEVSEVVDAVSRIFSSRRAPAGRGARTRNAPATGAVVTGNEAARMVIVMARVDEFPLIEQVIKELDLPAVADASLVKVYQLEHGDARSVANALTATLTQAAPRQRGRRAPRAAVGQTLRISPEPTANAVVVRASETEHQRIAALIKELDQPPAQQATFSTIALKRADARGVANALSRMLRSWPRKRNQAAPTVGFDAKTNTLMISGRQEDMDRVEAMVAKLEAGAEEQVQVQLIPLTNARAFDVAQELGGFYGPRARGAGPAEREVTVVADERTNSVLVSARPDQFADIAKLIGKLDSADPTGQGRTIVMSLTYAQADAVARAITQSFGPPRGKRVSPTDLVVAAAEPTTNALIVSASEQNLAKIEALVKQLDVETSGGRQVEFIILEHAKATDLAKTLSQVVVSRRRAPRRGGVEPPTVSADASSNALVMAGRKADLDDLMDMAKLLDQAAAGKTPDVYILSLTKADALDMADMVNQLFQAQAREARRAGKSVEPVAVTADVRANALIVAASQDQFAVVRKLVNQIDDMSAARAKLQVIQLKYANPQDVLKAIEQLYGSGANGRVTRPGQGRLSGRGSGPEATVLSGQRALLVNASEEDMKAIQELIDAMDKAAEAAKLEVLLFSLANASNTRVATALNSMYARAVRPGHPEDKVTVAPLAGTNAVVVTAAKEKMQEVGDLIRQMDKPEIAGKAEFRLYPLTRAKAVKILPLLNQMLQPMRQMRPTQPITVTADATTNTIVVATHAPVLEEIEKIIKTLDNVQVFEAAEVMIIRLKNANAGVLADALTDMLTPGTSQIQTPEAKALQEQIRLLRMVKGKEGTPPLDLSKPIKITADPLRGGQSGSNSLIISSTADNLKALAEIVSLLDTIPLAKGVKLQIIHLENADAITTTALLRDIFTQGRQLTGRPGTPTAGKALLPEGVVGEALTSQLNITADARTNTLVLAGPEETVALAMLMVKDLDRQPTSEFTEVKLFKLIHADAADLANLLRAVFAERAAAVPGVEGAKAYVTRLRIQRDKRRPVEAKVARSHPTLAVQAETKANILIVAARSDLIAIIDEMVKTIDVPGAGSMTVLRIYPLNNADASRMAQVINGLYTGPNANLIRPEDKPTITVDTRTNSLVVSSSEKTFAMIDALLRKLDAKLPVELRDIRLVPLQNAEAVTLAPTLQQMMDARVQRQVSLGVKDAEALRMIIVADARSNSLIVGGSAEGFKVVADLAKQLDSAAPALSGQIRLIPLTNANSGTLSATLNNLFNQRYQRAARTPDVRRQQPVIVPDLRTNSLMVAANQDDSKLIESLVGKLDARPVSPAVELVVLPLKFNDAGSVGPMIQRIFADRLTSMTPPTQQPAPQDIVSVATDALSNALVVSASKENLVFIRELLAKVDVEPPVETGVVKLYQIKHADVSRVEAMLRALLTQGLYKPGLVGAGDNAIARAREKVAIASDIRTNVLIVSASKENFAVIDEIVRRVDLEEGWGLTGNIKVYILKHADASRLGPVLQQMFDRKRAAEGATGTPPRSLPVVVIPDERTNSLLVAGSREAFDAVDGLVTRLDVSEVVQTYDFRVFYLKQASAATLEPVLRQLFAQRTPRGRAAQPATIIADPKMNALIVGADKDDLAIAESLIARLDTPPPAAGQVVRAFAVTQADAAQLAQTLQRLFQAQRPGAPIGIAVSVDERSNIILVSAAPADMNSIADLVKKLDTAPVTDVTEIRIFTLRHADASQLATILTDALTNKPKPLTAESPNRVTLLRFIAEMPNGKKLIESALKRGVMITAVSQTNSLLVQAPVETMPLLGKLIQALDQTNPCVAEIRVFPLTNADATQMARVLGELFRLQISPTQRQAATYTMSPAGGGQAPTTQPAAAMFGSAEQNALTITVDRRTNSLLVGGTREYVDLVASVIKELDASRAEDRQSVVYRLRNAQAGDVEQALQGLLDQERQRIVATLGADAVGAAKELLAREISVVAEENSNTLVISGSPRFFQTVWEIVRELDQPPPQVLIEVLLAEVTLEDRTNLGMEWSLLTHPKNRTVGGGTAFGIGTGGFSFTVSSGDFELLLRALQTQGRVEIIQAPRIVASDNQAAEANVGQDVPYVTSSRVTEGGSVFNTVTHRTVGIKLNVTPRINPDGFVKMTVRPEISSLSESTVMISEGLSAPIFNTSYANTTVTVQDGHTIVIGGLITKREENREEKVPILGDIPLLGWLFKSTRIIRERTELLIILTPRVLRRPTDADVITNKMIRQLGLSRGIHTDASIGELLNPLRGVTPQEVQKLERGEAPSRGGSGAEMIVIPVTPVKEERRSPPEGVEHKK